MPSQLDRELHRLRELEKQTAEQHARVLRALDAAIEQQRAEARRDLRIALFTQETTC